MEAAGEEVQAVEQAPAQPGLQEHTLAAAADSLAWALQVVQRTPELG